MKYNSKRMSEILGSLGTKPQDESCRLVEIISPITTEPLIDEQDYEEIKNSRIPCVKDPSNGTDRLSGPCRS